MRACAELVADLDLAGERRARRGEPDALALDLFARTRHLRPTSPCCSAGSSPCRAASAPPTPRAACDAAGVVVQRCVRARDRCTAASLGCRGRPCRRGRARRGTSAATLVHRLAELVRPDLVGPRRLVGRLRRPWPWRRRVGGGSLASAAPAQSAVAAATTMTERRIGSPLGSGRGPLARHGRDGRDALRRDLAGGDVVVPELVVLLGPALVDVAGLHRPRRRRCMPIVPM